jgi:hypothetical protein
LDERHALKQIVYKTIQTTAIQNSMNNAFRFKDLSFKSLRVMPADKQAFNELMTGNVFGGGVKKMLYEYVGMKNREVIATDITKLSSYEMTSHLS